MLVGPQPHLALAIGRPHPGALDRNAPAAERYLAILVAMPDRGPVAVPPTLRPDDLLDLLLQQFTEHAETDLDRQRQQALPRGPEQLPESFLNTLGQHGLIVDRLGDRYV